MNHKSYTLNFILILLLILLSNFFVIYEGLFYLNEDAALILGIKSSFENNGFSALIDLFFSWYGPHIIRPFQLIGMFFENVFLSLTPDQSLLSSIFYLALGSLFFFLSLKKISNIWIAYISLFFLLFSSLNAESVLWLSGRHDLYLFLFFSLIFYFYSKYICGEITNKKSLTIIFSFLVWCSFWSNEKSVSIPFIIITSHFLFYKLSSKRIKEQLISYKQSFVFICTIFTINFLGYCLYRFYIIGQLVGGYDNSFFPENMSISKVAINMITIPILSAFDHKFTTLLIFIYLFIFLKLILRENKSLKDMFLFFIGSYCILALASFPTLKGFGGHTNGYEGILNVRLFWMPHIMMSIIQGYLWFYVIKNTNSILLKKFIISILVLNLFIMFYANLQSSKAYASASNLAKKAVFAHGNYCQCFDRKRSQVSNIPIFYAGINSFNPNTWVETMSGLHNNLPECNENSLRCRIEFQESSKDFLNLELDFHQK